MLTFTERSCIYVYTKWNLYIYLVGKIVSLICCFFYSSCTFLSLQWSITSLWPRPGLTRSMQFLFPHRAYRLLFSTVSWGFPPAVVEIPPPTVSFLLLRAVLLESFYSGFHGRLTLVASPSLRQSFACAQLSDDSSLIPNMPRDWQLYLSFLRKTIVFCYMYIEMLTIHQLCVNWVIVI